MCGMSLMHVEQSCNLKCATSQFHDSQLDLAIYRLPEITFLSLSTPQPLSYH
jgi:hypothetical protein